MNRGFWREGGGKRERKCKVFLIFHNLFNFPYLLEYNIELTYLKFSTLIWILIIVVFGIVKLKIKLKKNYLDPILTIFQLLIKLLIKNSVFTLSTE